MKPFGTPLGRHWSVSAPAHLGRLPIRRHLLFTALNLSPRAVWRFDPGRQDETTNRINLQVLQGALS